MYNLKYSLCPFNQYQELSPTNFTNTEKSIFVLYSSFAQNTNVSSIFKVTMGSMWNFCQCLKRAAKVKTCNNLLGLLAPYCVWRHTPSKRLHSPSATDPQTNALKSGVAWHRQRQSMSNSIQTHAPYQEPYDTVLNIKAALSSATAHQSSTYDTQADRQNLSQS